MKTCEYASCGKPFEPAHHHQRYCGGACSLAARALSNARFRQKENVRYRKRSAFLRKYEFGEAA